ncbi:MAG: alpha/beta hydrolase [Verrucomicrobia bacterium]|nr:alpha/beta hydrolase [Verrucomicrobiota bacterium]
MPRPVDGSPTNSLPPVEQTAVRSEKNSKVDRIAKAILIALSAALILGAVGAACYTFAFPLAVTLIVASVALAVLGITIALNKVAHKFPKPLEKAIRKIHATVTELFALVAAIVQYPFSALLKKKITPEAPDQRNVLLIHGYLHNPTAFSYAMPRLKEAGFGNIHTIHLWHPFRSIEHDYAKDVQKKMKEITAENRQKEWILIGHSMGGDVAAQAATTLPDDSVSVSHVVTWGSPLKGAPAAKLAAMLRMGQNAQEMQVGSTFTENLQQNIPTCSATQFSHVASYADSVVPGEYAHLGNDPEHEMVMDDINHIGMLYDPRVIDQTIDWIKPQVDPV